MSKLLINESPLLLLPSLASAIGLNEAIVLQQVHYWVSNPNTGKIHDGRRWIYNTLKEWQAGTFPFWSEATLQRVFLSLRKKEILLTANLNETAYDRTLWYTIDYKHLSNLHTSIISNCDNGVGQYDAMDYSNLTSPIPETTQRQPEEYQESKPQTPNHPQWKMPEPLNTADFEAAWMAWYSHRYEVERPLTQTAGEYQLGQLAQLGEARAIAAINHSIANGWKSIHEPDGKAKNKTASKGWHPV